jgi:hypothetical protein
MSTYVQLYEHLLAGNRVTLTGVAKATVKRGLYAAKATLEAQATDLGMTGFKLDSKHIAMSEPSADGSYDVWFESPRPRGFGHKIQILGMQPSGDKP